MQGVEGVPGDKGVPYGDKGVHRGTKLKLLEVSAMAAAIARQCLCFCFRVCTFVPVKQHLYLEIRSYGALCHRCLKLLVYEALRY